MYPSSESACSCSTEGSVSHCKVLMSPNGGVGWWGVVGKRGHACLQTDTLSQAHKHIRILPHGKYTQTHSRTDHLSRELLNMGIPIEFHAKMALLMETNASISGYSVGGLYIRETLYFIMVQCTIYLKIFAHHLLSRDLIGLLPGIYNKKILIHLWEKKCSTVGWKKLIFFIGKTI